MRINKYNTMMDEHRLPYLVKESGMNYPEDSLNNPEAVFRMMKSVFDADKQTEEYLWLLCLNAKNRITGVFEVSHGTIDYSLVSPREIFMKAMLCGANRIMIAHNHPSGDTEPSQEDISVTKRIRDCGKMMDIVLLDHIIIGDDYYSFMEEGLLK